MKRNVKLSVFAIVMSTIMLITSLAVMARETTAEVALSGSTGYATTGIDPGGLYAWAYTRGSSSSNSIVSTRITGRCSEPVSGRGVSSAECTAYLTPFYAAESYHQWTARSYSGYITP